MTIDTRAIRLTPDASLAVFRVLLDAVSHPGRRFDLHPDVADLPAAALALLSLGDIDVTFAVVGPDSALTAIGGLIARSTGARPTTDLTAAALVLAGPGTAADDLAGLRTGSADEPELGAKLFVACDRLDAPACAGPTPPQTSVRLVVAGPGASSGRVIDVFGIDHSVLEHVSTMNTAFPAGVDTWIVATNGAVVAVPRSCSIDLTRGVH